MLSLGNLNIKNNAYVYDRLSSKKQEQSFETHIPIILKAVQNSQIHFDNVYQHTEIISGYYDISETLCTILDQRNIHLFVFSACRLTRNLKTAGYIIEKIKANSIIIHVVGVEQPYVCDTPENIRKLFMEMVSAYDEAVMISERSKRYHSAQKQIRLSKPPEPPTASHELLLILKYMLEGCDNIKTFYDIFNKVTPLGETDEKLGGDLYFLEGKDRKEMTSIKKGDFSLKDILRMFNQWKINEKGNKNFTMISLERLINYFFVENMNYNDNDMVD
jgi:hypothetical protein